MGLSVVFQSGYYQNSWKQKQKRENRNAKTANVKNSNGNNRNAKNRRNQKISGKGRIGENEAINLQRNVLLLYQSKSKLWNTGNSLALHAIVRETCANYTG